MFLYCYGVTLSGNQTTSYPNYYHDSGNDEARLWVTGQGQGAVEEGIGGGQFSFD
jgi:hypothetical protein